MRDDDPELGWWEADLDDEDNCAHEEYEADILTGRAVCVMCGHAWYQTLEEIAREHEHEIAYAKHCEEWDREQARADGESVPKGGGEQ